MSLTGRGGLLFFWYGLGGKTTRYCAGVSCARTTVKKTPPRVRRREPSGTSIPPAASMPGPAQDGHPAVAQTAQARALPYWCSPEASVSRLSASGIVEPEQVHVERTEYDGVRVFKEEDPMQWNPRRPIVVALMSVGLLVSSLSVVDASHDRNRPSRAVSYINPDTGAATANADVDPNSNCFSPDRSDTQKLSDAGTTNRNVHNDACFFGNSWRDRDQNATKVDGPATYESKGVGFISACPDPDGAGAKIAILSADKKRCFQSGYQEKGIAGDQEFHARLNNDSTPGTQTVVWCYDANRNGCSDEYIKDTITINWTQ